MSVPADNIINILPPAGAQAPAPTGSGMTGLEAYGLASLTSDMTVLKLVVLGVSALVILVLMVKLAERE